jgi:ankyrin repeat protein
MPLTTVFLALVFGHAEPAGPGLDADLLRAVRTGETGAARSLLRRGANANARDADGTTALMWAVARGDGGLMDALLEGGADVNARNKAGATALMWAVGSRNSLERLLDRGADVRARAESGFTALTIAANSDGAAESIKPLLDHGADAKDASGSGFSALMAAAGTDSDEAVMLLLRKGADAKARNRAGYTALHAAAMSGRADRVRALLDAGAEANATETSQGRTPLMWAADSGAADVVELLLARGAGPNVQGSFGGHTALMWAAARANGDDRGIKALLAARADAAAPDKRGLTALDWALRQGDGRVAALLHAPDRSDARSTDARPAARTVGEGNIVRAALGRSLPLLERAGPAFAAASDERCVSCHHQSLPAMALGLALARGLPVDARLLREQAAETRALLAPKRELYFQGLGAVDRADPGYWLAGLAAAGLRADDTTDALVHYLTLKQCANGRWRATLVRPPMGGSDFSATALSLRALQHFARPARAMEVERRITRARDWLRSAMPKTTEDRAFQLLGLAWSRADRDAVRKSAAALLALRREDGGWGQLPTRGTDAYATGEALYALSESGALAAADAAYGRGVAYVLRTQCEDGSWFVPTRAMSVQPYFQSGFPHGRSQFISCAATCWATMALTLTSEP